jgi:hypothetical protein
LSAARLIEDGGAAAADPTQFFRSPEFLAAEGATHTLAIGQDPVLAVPVIVRAIEGTGRVDATSPYGYPGGTSLSAGDAGHAPRDPGDVDWSDTGLVSVFIRDRIGDRPALAGGTVRSQVQIADPGAESGLRKRLREQIRRNERRGWTVDALPGPEADPEARSAFERAYG